MESQFASMDTERVVRQQEAQMIIVKALPIENGLPRKYFRFKNKRQLKVDKLAPMAIYREFWGYILQFFHPDSRK
jgi:hypothetical protein